jgi:hypothetical protein
LDVFLFLVLLNFAKNAVNRMEQFFVLHKSEKFNFSLAKNRSWLNQITEDIQDRFPVYLPLPIQ